MFDVKNIKDIIDWDYGRSEHSCLAISAGSVWSSCFCAGFVLLLDAANLG